MADAQLTKVAAPDGEKDLFEHRISLDLTPENAVFTPSAGSLISLTLTQPSGEVEFFERVVPVRAFPRGIHLHPRAGHPAGRARR